MNDHCINHEIALNGREISSTSLLHLVYDNSTYLWNGQGILMIRRMIGAALLQGHIYEEVENDHTATLQAALVVIIVSISTALGAYFEYRGNLIVVIAAGSIFLLIKWVVWALILYIVGSKLLHIENTQANWGQMARATAFAQVPGILTVLVFISEVGSVIALGVFLWKCVATIIAVKHVLDYDHLMGKFLSVQVSTWRSVEVVVVGFSIVLVPAVILLSVLSVLGVELTWLVWI